MLLLLLLLLIALLLFCDAAQVGFIGEGSAASNVTFAKETGVAKDDAPVSNLRLYEQLEVNKAKKEEEFQKKYKANFAPPSALGEEDVVFFEQKEEAERARLRERQTLDESDHASFLEALANGNAPPSLFPV